MIGNLARRLLEEPSRWAVRVGDPLLISRAVDETLRYDPSVPAWRRLTTRPATLGGVGVPAGAKRFLWLAASGRDGSVFPEPERFDLRRKEASRTLAFGKGIHCCLGAALGKPEAQLALEGLTRRFPRRLRAPGRAGIYLGRRRALLSSVAGVPFMSPARLLLLLAAAAAGCDSGPRRPAQPASDQAVAPTTSP